MKQSWYEFISNQNTVRSNEGFNYEGKIFEKTLSNQVLNGDQNRIDILASIERVVYQLFETTKYIKNYINLLFFDKKGDRYNFNWNGNYWEGAVLFPLVAEKLFEIEHVFVIEEFINSNTLQTEYGFPHADTTSPATPVWRT